MNRQGERVMRSPQKFVKRPVEIWAVQYIPHENCQQIRTWMGESDVRDCSNEDTDVPLAIDTLEGQMWAQPGDWIIRGVAGEFYPCKPDIFAATYDEPPRADPQRDEAQTGERTRASIRARLDPKLWARVQDGMDGEAWTCGDLRVIWSVAKELDSRHWLHVSVSRATRLPSYSDMTRVKSLFVGDDAIAYSVYAPGSQHVNIHQNCLHLWAPLDGGLPLPDFTRGGRSI